MNISFTRCGDKVVALPGLELHLHGGGGEGPEGDGEVHKILRLITDSNYSGFRIRNPATVKLFFVYTVNDVFLSTVHSGWADDVHLVILPGVVILVHFYHMAMATKHGVGYVPIHINRLDTHHTPEADHDE